MFSDVTAGLTWMAAIGMVAAVLGEWVLPADFGTIVGLVGLVLVYAAGGVPAGYRALRSLFRDRILDIDMLMVVAAIAAAAVGAPLEGAVLLTLFSISTTLEARALGRARRAIESLMALRPETALRKARSGKVTEVPAIELRPGDLVVLRPGARVPADGVIASGRGMLDESTITGESMPVRKAPGAKVFEATVNLDGVLEVEISKTLGESTVARMIELVTKAQAAKAPSERFSTWFGQRYTIAVMVGAVLAFAAFHWLGRTWDDALYRAATLLVAASPCAIVISVPAAILSALSASARGGVLFKGGAALETLATVERFAFDKTGTLTTGQAEVTDVVVVEGGEAEFLALLAGLETHSEHHIADAVQRHAATWEVRPESFTEVVSRPGEGIEGRDGSDIVWAGNVRMAERMGVALDSPRLADVQAGDRTVVYVGRGSSLLGAVSVADRVRESSAAGIAALRDAGISSVVMITGDRRPVALRVGAELGIEPGEIHADMLPEEKVRKVSELAGQGRVAFVGDGVNDAAALARADVGIAMGAAGSEVALQAADVALLSEDMTRLAAAHRLSRRTAAIIRQNLAFAIGAMIILVTGSLFFDLPLPLAVIGHEGGTVLVVLNGLRMLADPIRVDKDKDRGAVPPAGPSDRSYYRRVRA